MRVVHLTMFAACLAAASAAAAQPDRIEGPEIGDRVRRDLGTLFRPGGSLEATTGDLSLAQGNLRTRPYATIVTGVCRMDEVTVSYAGREVYGGGAAANAIEPFGIVAQARFKVLRIVREAERVNRGRPFAGECGALDGAETRGWFLAPDVYVAAGGHKALAAARAQLDAGASIRGCRESRQARVDCGHTLGTAAEELFQIASCDAALRRFCFGLGLTDGTSVTIRLHYNGRGEERIDSIHIEGPPISI